MATLISVIAFDDTERQALAGDTKDRTDLAKGVSNALNTQIKGVLTRARNLADANPSHEDLVQVKTEISEVRQVLQVLPDGEARQGLTTAFADINEVVESAIAALPASY